MVLFAIACGGGFALARVVSGQNLLPPQTPETGVLATLGTVGGSSEPLKLVPQHANASATANVSRDSEYTLSVPEGWQRFIASRKFSFGTSTVVQYISPDGRQSLRLERIPNFYEKYSEHDAIAAVRSSGSPDSFTFTRDPAQTPNGVEIMFRAVERAQSNSANPDAVITRATYALIKQSENTLWLLSLTVPAEQEDTASATFNQIAPTLSFPASS